MARITGVGGVFFKSRGDHRALAAWYRDNLGLVFEEWGGVVLRWPQDPVAADGATVWHVAEATSTWFAPSDSAFMINYRVDDLDALVVELAAKGVALVGERMEDDNGKFAWVMDPDGNKVELWQPKPVG